MSKLYYLATPYSKFPKGREVAFEEACYKAASLMEQGFLIFCPIAHSHSVEDVGMVDKKSGDWWLRQDFTVLARCDELLVYKMPGWDESYGVKAEICFARDHNIPVSYLEYSVPEQHSKAFV